MSGDTRVGATDPSTRRKQVVTFGAVSLATTLLDFGVFNLLVLGDFLQPVVANTISYGLGIAASYTLNRNLTFAGGGRDSRAHEMALFVAINVVGLVLNNIAVAIATDVAGEDALLLNAAKLAAGAAVWAFKFVTFKRWVYPTRSAEAGRSVGS